MVCFISNNNKSLQYRWLLSASCLMLRSPVHPCLRQPQQCFLSLQVSVNLNRVSLSVTLHSMCPLVLVFYCLSFLKIHPFITSVNDCIFLMSHILLYYITICVSCTCWTFVLFWAFESFDWSCSELSCVSPCGGRLFCFMGK